MRHAVARGVAGLLAVFGSASLLHAPAPDGAELYKRTCAQCHDTGANRAPGRDAFRAMPAERVMAAMETGSMLNRIYITTGNNYSDPTSTMSDSFLAMDLDTGKILWSRQMTEKDAYTAACRLPDKTNCADSK